MDTIVWYNKFIFLKHIQNIINKENMWDSFAALGLPEYGAVPCHVMKHYAVLYNPLAGNGRGKEASLAVREYLTDGEVTFTDMTSIAVYKAFFASLPTDTEVVIAGGDGTLNRFINDVDGLALPADIYYYAVGSGNDFLHDLGKKPGDAPCLITEYIQNLPVAEVNGKRYRFLNGVGYGIDGYCCEVGDKLRATAPGKPINYAGIAIKGLLFHYPPKNAVVTVDGVAHRYKKTWLAPTMNGRYYGGGMMPTPEQHRGNADGTVSTMIMAGSGKLRTLMIFPSIFKGEHVNYKRTVHVLTGKTIKVEFDRPTALQIDGETILGVKEYTVYGGNKNAARQTMAESAATV